MEEDTANLVQTMDNEEDWVVVSNDEQELEPEQATNQSYVIQEIGVRLATKALSLAVAGYSLSLTLASAGVGAVVDTTTSVVSGGLIGGIPGALTGFATASVSVATRTAATATRLGIQAALYAGSEAASLVGNSLTKGRGKVVRQVVYVRGKDGKLRPDLEK